MLNHSHNWHVLGWLYCLAFWQRLARAGCAELSSPPPDLRIEPGSPHTSQETCWSAWAQLLAIKRKFFLFSIDFLFAKLRLAIIWIFFRIIYNLSKVDDSFTILRINQIKNYIKCLLVFFHPECINFLTFQIGIIKVWKSVWYRYYF